MANKSISQLNAGSAVSATDLFPDVQTVGIGPVKVTAAQLATYFWFQPTLVAPNIGTASGTALTLGTQTSVQGSLVLANTAGGAYSTTLKSSNSASAAWTLTLPTTAGSSGQALITDGLGNASWGPAGATISNDITTATPEYPLFSSVTTGSPSTVYVSSTKYTYTPSTGQLTALELAASNGIVVNANSVSANYSIPSNYNAFSAGPISVGAGVVVTVPAGSSWVVV